MNPLHEVREVGQSVWLDFLRRGLITTGRLEAMIDDYALSGVTSNPTIFGKAIGGSTDYDQALKALVDKGQREPIEIFYDLALADIQMAADVFRPVYLDTAGADGFVSFELEPKLAHDTAGSIAKAIELFTELGKPNVMIKVPGTDEGIAAVEELTAEGVNVNITLLFGVTVYERVAEAYLKGLERRAQDAKSVDRIASVASFFVSRVDTAVEKELPDDSPIRGKVGVANAKMAYQSFLRIFSGDRWDRLAALGARVQKPLWASTGTKNPAYSDVLYIEELVGPHTVNTMPQQTMDAFKDHGAVRPNAVMEGADEAAATLKELGRVGIDLDQVCERLVADGINSFDTDLGKLLETIERKTAELQAGKSRWTSSLNGLGASVKQRLDRMHDEEIVARVWRRDHTVWNDDPTEISDRLGWLSLSDFVRERFDQINGLAAGVFAEDFEHVVLLGMGGSSLAPQVLRSVIGPSPEALDLTVLDTTHPSTIRALESRISMDKTLFIVASKSGGTVETLSHFKYFFEKVPRPEQFVAITDPGSPLEALGRRHNFREVFLNHEDVGGRYSALSLFGLVPGALMGIDPDSLLDQAEEMAIACHESMHGEQNPGAWLGSVLGEAALAGRDKLTFVLPQTATSFGDWAEQLVAESTGKNGRGIVPVVGELLGSPEVYSDDRIFLSLGDVTELAALEKAGHPTVKLPAGIGLGGEFYRFEFAAAIAGYVLGINPFDQPNVAEAKAATAEVLAADAPFEEPGGVNELKGLLSSATQGDYISLQAFVDENAATTARLQAVRTRLRDGHKTATTVGFGPRFLHSTGQLHKGGPATGIFIQIVDGQPGEDLAIPDAGYTFGRLINAQAEGDLHALRKRSRRVVRTTLEGLEQALAAPRPI